jgi:hypothetical protein
LSKFIILSASISTRTYRSARYFSRGEFARLCPEALRKAGGPITTAEIVASIIAAKGLPENLAANLPEKTLTYLRGKLAAGTAKNSAITQGARWVLTDQKNS